MRKSVTDGRYRRQRRKVVGGVVWTNRDATHEQEEAQAQAIVEVGWFGLVRG